MSKKRNLIIIAALIAVLSAVIAGAIFLSNHLQENEDIAALVGDGATGNLVGQAAPDFKFLGEQGHVEMISDYRGTPIVLNFWASWCPPCRMQKPFFQEAYDIYGNEVKFFMMNIDEPIEVARAYMDEEGYTLPIYFDEAREGAQAYGLTGVPETFFIDAEGIVRAHFVGPINMDTIRPSIEAILP